MRNQGVTHIDHAREREYDNLRPEAASEHAMSAPPAPQGSLRCDGVVSWPCEWSLVDGEIRVRATIQTKNPPQTIVVKIDLNELKNRIFRAQIQALLAS